MHSQKESESGGEGFQMPVTLPLYPHHPIHDTKLPRQHEGLVLTPHNAQASWDTKAPHCQPQPIRVDPQSNRLLSCSCLGDQECLCLRKPTQAQLPTRSPTLHPPPPHVIILGWEEPRRDLGRGGRVVLAQRTQSWLRVVPRYRVDLRGFGEVLGSG